MKTTPFFRLMPKQGFQGELSYVQKMALLGEPFWLSLFSVMTEKTFHVGKLTGQVVRRSDLKWKVNSAEQFEYDRWHHVTLTWTPEDGLILYQNGKCPEGGGARPQFLYMGVPFRVDFIWHPSIVHVSAES